MITSDYLFSRVSIGFVRQPFLSLTFSKCHNDCNILILVKSVVQLFCYKAFVHQKLKLLDFPWDFVLNSCSLYQATFTLVLALLLIG